MNRTLRGYWRSSCTWRVRIALELKGLTYDTVPVHLVQDGGQQHGTEHRAVNPMREVPVLLDDNEPLAQSMAILEYLEETVPEPALLPKEALGRARVRQLAEIVNSGIQPIQNLRVMQRLGREYNIDKPGQIQWSRDWIHFGFEGLHALIEQYGGQYAYGNSITFADLCLIPQLYNARRFSVDLSRFPRLTEIEAACAEHPAFIAAHPDQQPDALA